MHRLRRQRYIDPRLPSRIDAARKGERGADHPFGLTTQQLRVVRLMANEHTNPEIARRLGISPETVKSHVDHVLDKLGAYDRIHAARIAAAHEELRPVDPGNDARALAREQRA